MAKEIWLGPVLGSNREHLLGRCADYLSRGQADRLLYLAASHPLLDLVTEKLLDGKAARGVWGEFPVYLFRGFVRRVLSGADSGPGPSRVPIDREDLPLRRSLISQIIKQLSTAGQLQAIKPLANRDGCVNTIATLLGELQRSGKTPDEFQQAIAERLEARGQKPDTKDQGPASQSDFDREVALIYANYSAILDRHGLTDDDADQLRALQVLRGEPEGQEASLAWLRDIELLVLDGFFDFTPVQGEILRCLIPQVPNVIVNLNYDEQNEDIFRPFQSTIDQLQSMAPFATTHSSDSAPVNESLAPLRARLFNGNRTSGPSSDLPEAGEPPAGTPALQLLECSDRGVEIRAIAREIKRLVLSHSYQLSDIALVVRERAAYAETIVRVFAAESIACNLERRVDAPDIPAVRACGKLFQLLREAPEQVKNPKASDLAHLIKTDYFRISDESLAELTELFDAKYQHLLTDPNRQPDANEKLRPALGIGRWRADDLENVLAYVGSELRVDGWIDRALKLIRVFPAPGAAQSLIAGDEPEDAATAAQDEASPDDGAAMDRRKKPTPVHPAAIGWTVLIMRRLQQLLSAMPEEGPVDELRRALMQLLAQLQFSNQVNVPFQRRSGASDVPQATLDVRGRESLRRAIVAAVRSFNYASAVVSEAPPDAPRVALSSFIDEVARCLSSQTLAISAGNRDGLRVLEATDVRGLRFRAIFIAGMIEGGFPLRTSRDWLYPHEERVRLQKHGIFLEDISTDTLLKEEHYFYQATCRATERLYLTRPLTLNDGAETVPSYYIEELKRAVAPAAIEIQQVRGDIDGLALTESSTAVELGTVLIRQAEAQGRSGVSRNLSPAIIAELLRQAQSRGYVSPSAMARVKIEHERNGERFGPYDGEITNADLREMLARHFGSEHIYSASRLSTYGNCAFRFFGNRVLRIEPRTEAALDLQAIDAGKLLHDILRRFFEKHRGECLTGREREALRQDLATTADEVFREHEDKVPPLNERIWKIDCEIRKLILDQVLLYELKLQEKSSARGVLPAFFELAFGRASQAADPSSTTDFLRLKRARQDAIDVALIQGQIDRVDVNRDARIAIAYDYKLSEGAKLNDIRSGRQVQIPIYLAALEQLFLPSFQLGGGGYYTLRAKGARLNQGLYREAFADCTIVSSRHTRMSDDEWQRIRKAVELRVWEFIDGMRGGHFRVKPSLGRMTCKYCDYSAVCRYDPYRMSRKN
ncbi:MAG TPA: PD-(D/E)XK nuclease family protein [Pyrinomonadaceae bacterium]|nr:PD-(D/E)XK nuclease family protein [Pyrinomonadaceae bacterium]